MSELGNKQIMANNIRRYMEMKGISRAEFCRRLGFKYSTVTDWLNAEKYPRIDKIELMANFFNISKADLVEPFGSTFAGQSGNDFLDLAGQVNVDEDYKSQLLRNVVKESPAKYDKARKSITLTEYFKQRRAKELLERYFQASDEVKRIVDYALGLSESNKKSHPKG